MKNTDNETEQQMEDIKSKLLKLDYEFKAHFMVTQKELQTQKEPLDKLATLSQRYLIFTNSKTEPRHKRTLINTTAAAEDLLLQEFNENLKILHDSGRRMQLSTETLLSCYKVFRTLCAEQDFSIESPFMTGDNHHKPITLFIEHFDDLVKYSSSLTVKFNYRMKLLDIEEPKSVQNYKALLVPSKNFEEYFYSEAAYMKHLQPRSKKKI